MTKNIYQETQEAKRAGSQGCDSLAGVLASCAQSPGVNPEHP